MIQKWIAIRSPQSFESFRSLDVNPGKLVLTHDHKHDGDREQHGGASEIVGSVDENHQTG